jgi:hypothetical protein
LIEPAMPTERDLAELKAIALRFNIDELQALETSRG